MDQYPPQDNLSQPPVYAQVVREPAYPRQKSHFFSKLLLLFLVLGFFGSIALNMLLFLAVAATGLASADDEGRVQEKFVSGSHTGRDKVAVLSIEGTILSGEGFFKHQIDHARKDIEDGSLRAIVLRINSPGGTVSGSDYMLHHLRKLVKTGGRQVPIVVSMGAIAASGGYYAAMCVNDTPDSIFAERSTFTGSIGVIIPHYNAAELIAKLGIQDDAVASNPLKTIGSITRRMTPAERKIFQSLVDEGFTQFKDVVKSGRPKFHKDPAALDALATGQIFTSEQAVENGLVDRIGFIEDAIDRAIELAHLDPHNVKVVKYKAEPHLSELLFGASQIKASLDLAALLDATTPRAYYLCTGLPLLTEFGK